MPFPYALPADSEVPPMSRSSAEFMSLPGRPSIQVEWAGGRPVSVRFPLCLESAKTLYEVREELFSLTGLLLSPGARWEDAKQQLVCFELRPYLSLVRE